MISDAELHALARAVTPRAAYRYATTHGWQPNPRGEALGVYLFQDSEMPLRQLQIPIHGQDVDFTTAILDVGSRLAEKEQRSISAVISDMFFVGSDILRFRVISDRVETGNVSLDGGLSLLTGARQSILASACSVKNPVTFHPRMSWDEAQQMVRATKLAQTEYGSFVVKIACPVEAVVMPGEAQGTFVRSATSLLLRSAGLLASAIDRDELNKLESADTGTVISANFCDALEQMHVVDEDAQLQISAIWSGLLPRPADVPAVVDLRSDHFPAIADIAQRLRPNLQPGEKTFVGTVEEMRGDLMVDGRRAGEVILGIIHEGKVVSARAILNANFHAVADSAYMTGAKVKVRGHFQPGRRLHQITAVSGFAIVE